jgi:hypothetical protein
VGRALPVYPDESPREHVDHDGTRWRRTGYCCRCGACCVGDPYTGASDVPCPHLVADAGDGLPGCVDRQGAYYLSGCVSWPSVPGHVAHIAECTYRFERVG